MYHKKNVDYVYLLWEDLIPKPTKSTTLLHLEQNLQKQKNYKKKADEPVTSPKKKPVQATKGLAVLSEVALSEVEQVKLATKRSKKDFHISHVSGLGDGVDTQSKVLDEQQQKTSDTNEETDEGDNDDDGESNDHDDDSDDERTKSDSDGIPNPNLTNVDQTEYEEEGVDERARTPSDYVLTDEEKLDYEESIDDEEDDEVIKELYDDVNVNLGNDDTDMIDAIQGESEMSELKQTNQFAKDVSLNLGVVNKYLASNMKEAVNVVVQLQTNKLREEAQAEHQGVLNQDTITSYGDVVLLKKGRDDQDKDEDPSAGSDRGMKRRKSGKDAESSKDSRSKENKSSSISKDASQSQHRSFDKSVDAEEPSYIVEGSGMQQDQEFITGDNCHTPK
nr:hypothetical protein [Tanacetum cinerariifolium]